MRIEFEMNGKSYAVSRGRRGELQAEVFIHEHLDGGYGFSKQKPEYWRRLNPRRFPRAVDKIIAEARIRGLLA